MELHGLNLLAFTRRICQTATHGETIHPLAAMTANLARQGFLPTSSMTGRRLLSLMLCSSSSLSSSTR
ncbi:hypothetical protein BHE74_00022577 [Ensete ventricosum]|uniref:Uncharacterized protein n=1 Tax=Ensete ventricosum TaxID=4639 RepID=A0A427B6X3_ENSVE|nr:hypothetical protein B296_00015206 [Ensete ventricosum]RWV99733.1 hypothetical protein GW17_00037351 [Ensete ventricosum]RWW69780.1 hypothetical protein BHE74_00022577 [Ensete ventricosum]RZR73032.1 hypothetical protein BHM03_00019275 [Ensete ventricosum]